MTITEGALVRATLHGDKGITYRVERLRWRGKALLADLRPVLAPFGAPITRHHGYRPRRGLNVYWLRRAP